MGGNRKEKIYYERGTGELKKRTFAHTNLLKNLIMLKLRKMEREKRLLETCLEV